VPILTKWFVVINELFPLVNSTAVPSVSLTNSFNLAEALAFAEDVQLIKPNFEENYTDEALSLVEAYAFSNAFRASDAMALTETFAKTNSYAANDALPITEATAKTNSFTINEALSIAESTAKTNKYAIVESVAIAETVVINKRTIIRAVNSAALNTTYLG
jgi:hypothetical protein